MPHNAHQPNMRTLWREKAVGTNRKLILIVEDEKPMARALQLKLDRVGFNTLIAKNGEAALQMIKAQPIDLILLDLVMPKMDGFTFLQHLNEKAHSVPIVVLSNLGQSEDIKKTKSLGVQEYFVKSNTTLKKIVEYITTSLKP